MVVDDTQAGLAMGAQHRDQGELRAEEILIDTWARAGHICHLPTLARVSLSTVPSYDNFIYPPPRRQSTLRTDASPPIVNTLSLQLRIRYRAPVCRGKQPSTDLSSFKHAAADHLLPSGQCPTSPCCLLVAPSEALCVLACSGGELHMYIRMSIAHLNS